MGTVFLLTGLACALFLVGAVLLTWGVRSGQWDDLDTPAERMLGDDPPAPSSSPSTPSTHSPPLTPGNKP